MLFESDQSEGSLQFDSARTESCFGPPPGIAHPISVTTVSIENLPLGMSLESASVLVELLVGRGQFNFLWLRFDERLVCERRLIVNLVSHSKASALLSSLQHIRSLKASWSDCQGLQANTQFFRDTAPSDFPEGACPKLFDRHGNSVPLLPPAKIPCDFKWDPASEAEMAEFFGEGFPKKRGEVSIGKVFVGGLSLTTDSRALRKYFAQFGRIEDCAVVRNFAGLSRRFGFCKFAEISSADACLTVKQHIIDGQLAGVRPYTKQQDQT